MPACRLINSSLFRSPSLRWHAPSNIPILILSYFILFYFILFIFLLLCIPRLSTTQGRAPGTGVYDNDQSGAKRGELFGVMAENNLTN
jgi:hypothetical protein